MNRPNKIIVKYLVGDLHILGIVMAETLKCITERGVKVMREGNLSYINKHGNVVSHAVTNFIEKN